MKRALFLAVALALLVGVAWFVRSNDGSTNAGAGLRGPGDDVGAEEVADAGPDDEPVDLRGQPAGGETLEGHVTAIWNGRGAGGDAVRDAAPELTAGAAPPWSGVRVRVVGTSGEPQADLDVQLWGGPGDPHVVREGRTDARGRLSLTVDWPEEPCDYRVLVVGSFPQLEASSWQARFASDAPPTDEVELVVPDRGTVRVRLAGPGGAPWTESAYGALGDAASPTPARNQPGRPFATAVDGVLEFAPVGLGGTVRVNVSVALGSPVVRELAGPRAPGEVVEHTVDLLTDHAALRLRARDEAGEPLRDTALRALVRYDLGGSGSATFGDSVRTDAEGRATLLLDTSERSPRQQDLWLTTGPGAGGDADDPDRSGEVPLPDPLLPGLVDLGDVWLEAPKPPPVLVNGLVVDAAGRPVEGARVRLVSPGSRALDSGGRPPSGKCDAAGRFELRGTWPGGELELWADGWYAGRARVPVREGESVDVVLTAPGAVEGSLLLEPELWAVGPSVLLVPEGEEDGLRSLDEVEPEDDGVFRFEPVAPGAYRLQVLAPGLGEPLFELTDLGVASGETVRDPRLQGIDLRGRLRLQRVTVRTADGSPVPEVRVGFASEQDVRTTAFPDGLVELLVPTGPVDLFLRPDGYARVRLDGLTTDHELVLPARLDAVLRVVLEVPVPEASVTLHPVLMRSGLTVWSATDRLTDSQDFDVEGVAPGELQLGWRVVRTLSGGGIATQRGSRVERDLVLRPEVPGQVLEVRVTAEELEQVLDGR